MPNSSAQIISLFSPYKSCLTSMSPPFTMEYPSFYAGTTYASAKQSLLNRMKFAYSGKELNDVDRTPVREAAFTFGLHLVRITSFLYNRATYNEALPGSLWFF